MFLSVTGIGYNPQFDFLASNTTKTLPLFPRSSAHRHPSQHVRERKCKFRYRAGEHITVYGSCVRQMRRRCIRLLRVMQIFSKDNSKNPFKHLDSTTNGDKTIVHASSFYNHQRMRAQNIHLLEFRTSSMYHDRALENSPPPQTGSPVHNNRTGRGRYPHEKIATEQRPKKRMGKRERPDYQ